MDPSVVKDLEDQSPEKRLAAVEALRASVRQNNGHFLVASLKRAFQSIEALMTDSKHQVRAATISLLCEIIPELAKGDELESYMSPILALIVYNMRLVELRRPSEQALKLYVKHTGNLAAVALVLQQHGTRSDDIDMRKAAVKFMPMLVQQVDKGGVDSRVLVLALVERLEDPEGSVVTATIESLLGIRGMLGETARKYIDSLKLSERRIPTSVPASMTVEPENTFVPAKVPNRSKPEGAPAETRFGIVPSELAEALQIEDWKVRAPAVQRLLDLISGQADLENMLPHVNDLMQLLIELLNDPNFKISLTSISIVGVLVGRLGPKMRKNNLEQLVVPLSEKFADKKIVIRQEAMKVMVTLMKQLKPTRMTELAVPIASHKNSYTREEIIHLFMLAVHNYGCKALDLQTIVRVFRDGLFDVKDRVRFIAMEAFTLLRSKLGQTAVEQFLAGIGQDVVKPLHARFQDSRIPTVSDSGLMDFALCSRGSSNFDSDPELSPVSSTSTGQRHSSTALVGQRPRHQSAGTVQHRQIPWKVPTLRSRAGPTAGGRRHRSAAAAIDSSASNSTAARPGADMTPDEITSALSPQSCPSEFGADHKHGDLFGDETAPPHMTDAWRLHENTDLQVEEAMSGLYSSWEGPVFGGSNSEATGSELLLSGDGGVVSSWQSLSPTTPSTSIFPGSLSSRLDYHLGSPSPVPSMLADVEEELELGAPAQSSQEKPSWLTPNGKNNDGKGGKRHGMSWDHFGAQTGDISGFSPDRHRSDDLRILKSKHKPSAPRRNPASGKLSSPGAAQKVPAQFESSPGLSSLNIGDSALPDMPELSLANPQRKLTGRLPRKLLKKDGQTPRDFDGHTPRKSSGGDNMGDGVMGIEGSGMNLRDSHDSKATNEATVPAVNSEIESGDLRPLDNPSKALNACMGQISTDKWDTQLDGLTKLRQLAVHHPDVLRASANVGQVNKDVLAACNSLRSNLSKNALRCICDLFEGLGRTMDPHIENTVKVMMNRLTEASGFINGEAEKVLSTMVMCATDTKVLTALMAMSNHRHPIIRSKSALFVDRCCEKIGTGLPATGMLDRLVQVLMAYASDSSQEARAYGKQTIGRVARLIPTELERSARRVLSASQQQNLEKFIADAAKHQSTSLPGRPRGFRGAFAKSSTRDQGNVLGALSIDTVSGRGARHGAAKGNEAKIQEMDELMKSLKSVDWQFRLQAIERLVQFVTNNLDIAHSRTQELVDSLEPRLSDSNVKVNTRALEALQQIIPSLTGSLDLVLLQLVGVVASAMASTNRQVTQLGGAVMDMLFGYTDKGGMVAAMGAAVTNGNQRVKALLLDKLAEVVHEVWVEKPQAIAKNVLPLAFKFVDEIKHDVREANKRLLIALQSFMGDAFTSQLDSCSLDCKAKVTDLIGNGRSGGTRRTPR